MSFLTGCQSLLKNKDAGPLHLMPAGFEESAHQNKSTCKAFQAKGGRTSVEADFDGDGIKDVAKIIRKKDGGQEFLYIWLSSKKYEPIILDEIGDLEALNNMSISLGQHGTSIQDACSRGNAELCDEKGPKEIQFVNDYLWYTECESAASIFYWDPHTKTIERVWYSD